MATSIEIILTAQNQISGDLKRVTADLGKMKVQVDRLTGSTVKNAAATQTMAASMQSATKAGRGLSSVLLALGGITLFVGAARTLVEFEQALAGVQAVIQPTAEEFQALSDIARDLGATTVFSATQAAAGIEFLGRAGFTANEALGAIEGTLNLAAAGGLELARAADIASNVLSAFNLEAAESGRVADVLALTAQSANTNVEQLGEAFRFVGPIAAAFGISIEDSAAALGVLGNAGLQASTAGTGLRRILSTLGSPTKKLNDLLNKLGLTFDQVNPATNDLTDIMELFAGTSLSAADALEVFGDRGAPAILAVTSQSDALRELNDALLLAEGTAARTAETLTDTLGGALKELRSAFEELILQFGDAGLGASLRDLTETVTGVIRVFTGTLDPLDENAILYQQIADAVKALRFILISLISVRVLSFFGGLITTLGTLGTTFRVAAVGATGFARAMIGLRTVVLGALGPLGWIVGIGLALLAFAEEDAPAAVASLLDIDAAIKLVQATADDLTLDQLKRESETQQKTVAELTATVAALDAAMAKTAATAVKAGKAISGFGKTSGGSNLDGSDIGDAEVNRIEQEQLQKRRDAANIELGIETAKNDELSKILKKKTDDETAELERKINNLAKLEAAARTAEINAANAVKNLDAAAALSELQTAQKLSKDIAIIRKAELDKSLAERTISLEQYYDGLEILALESLDAEIAIESQKNAALLELQAQQRAALAEQAEATIGRTRGDAEIAAVTARFAAEAQAQEAGFLQEQLALDNQLLILQGKRDAAVSKNDAARTKALEDQLAKDKIASDKKIKDDEDAQKDAFDREFDAIVAQRERLSAAAERDVDTGAESGFGLGSRLDEIDEDAVGRLTKLREEMEAFNAAAQDPITIEKLNEVGDTITDFANRANVNLERIKTNLASGLGDALFEIVDGTKSAQDAFADFARQFLRDIAKMILQQIALNAVKSAFGGFGASGGGLFASGGGYIGAAEGGFITGKGTSTSDSIPARLSNGEYVMQASAVRGYGVNFMEAINRMKLDASGKGLPSFNITRPRRARFAEGGFVADSGKDKDSGANNTNIRLVNVVDTNQTEDFLASSDGESLIVNIIRRNGSSIKSLLG
jgi:TP901 family phage tail tape measure protein